MTGTLLFDHLTEEAADAQSLQSLAKQMVAGAIASGKMLREQRERMFPNSDDPSLLAVAKAIQAEFQQWVREADEVYHRALALRKAGHSPANLSELNDLLGMTQAMLQVTPEDHLHSCKEPGTRMSIQELRREIHLRRQG